MWILLVIVIVAAIVIALLAGTGRIDELINTGTASHESIAVGHGYTFFVDGDYFHVTAKSDEEAWDKARRITGNNSSVRMLER